jgi:hypothetical protein
MFVFYKSLINCFSIERRLCFFLIPLCACLLYLSAFAYSPNFPKVVNIEFHIFICIGVYISLMLQLLYNRALSEKIKVFDNRLQAGDISEKARSCLELRLYSRIAASLVWIKEITRIIVQSQERAVSIAVSNEQRLNLLTDAHNKLNYLTVGCVFREKDELINLHDIMDDIIKIYSKEIVNSNLSLRVNISCKAKELCFDELLLWQIYCVNP